MTMKLFRDICTLAAFSTILVSPPAAAFTVNGYLQSTLAQLSAPVGTDIVIDSELEFVPAGGIFVQSHSSFITGSAPVGFYLADVNMDVSGIFGVQGQISGFFEAADPTQHARLKTSVSIINEVINTFAVPIDIDFSFIINGGEFSLIADAASTLRYELAVSDFGRRPIFESIGVLTGSSTFSSSFVSTGNDIGATQAAPGGLVDVPFSLQTVTFSNILPGDSVLIDYEFSVEADVNIAEVATWAFRDPATIGGTVPPTQVVITGTPSSAAVPNPSTLVLLAGGALCFAVIQRRTGRGSHYRTAMRASTGRWSDQPRRSRAQ